VSIEIDDPRRNFLVDALTLELFVGGNVAGMIQPGYALGGLPSRLPEGRSIYRLKGSVTVDGTSANLDTRIGAGSLIKTASGSRIIFVVGSDAFILRSNSELHLNGDGLLIKAMRILTGRILSVFGKRKEVRSITTATATIGIRGTGIYVESEVDLSYICTCYGRTRVVANADRNIAMDIQTKRHDKPVYVLPAGDGTQLIRPAPVINHTDAELAMIEALVGRKTPFPFPGGGYKKAGG